MFALRRRLDAEGSNRSSAERLLPSSVFGESCGTIDLFAHREAGAPT
jgi:hypothetical protein